jgi:hypothetical protein
MFGRRRVGRRTQRGVFSGANLRNAAIAGAGVLALKWWRNRQSSNRSPQPAEPMSTRNAGQTNWP